MRWDDLTLESEEQRALPGYRDAAVVRRFDAPEALDVRFYEVRAKSALNRVPERSAMPFRWTVNPYRGCTHACSYCLAGDTLILMGDGRARRLDQLRAGDEIYGTVPLGSYRRYVKTRVLDHWSSVKPAYRVTLDDGRELVASADHRFLTRRGWKHVVGAEQGERRRPHLTVGSRLLGMSRFSENPAASEGYRRGYLCGMIRGDGHVGSYSYRRAGRAHGDVHRFRLALADVQALHRARDYLDAEGIRTVEFAFSEATATTRAVTAIRTSARTHVEAIRGLIAWPDDPRDDWRSGFLAGIFDAEGSTAGGILRIANADDEILDRTRDCLHRFGFDAVLEGRASPNHVRNVRVRGGMREHLRLFQAIDSAITRKRNLEGKALKASGDRGVISVEPLNREMQLFDITTGTGDFIANGVVSHNCFARPTHTYLGFGAGRDFDREIVVKVNAPELVRRELARASWKGEHVALGTNTDPYQWVESRYKLMPGIWAALRDAANPCSILTKSPLLLRDLPLMQEIGERTSITACLSIPTLDERAWRATEPHTPSPRARLEAVGKLNAAGVPTGVLIAPLMPGINDAPEQVEPLLARAAEMGATSVGMSTLHLRGETRDVFFAWLRAQRPDLLERYERLYRRGAYLPNEERHRLAGLVHGERGSGRWRPLDRPRSPRAPPPLPLAAEDAAQDSLF